MKIGICRNMKECLEGYPHKADYVEISAMDILGAQKEIYPEFKKAVDKGEIITYSCNGLFPGDVRLTGDVNWDTVKAYCDETFYKLAEVKIHMLVFGSGKAKHVPDGFDRQKAWDQLYELGALLSDTAKQYGQTVVVEPLSYSEVNIVNTVDEGAEYCKVVNRDNFKLLVDFYHFDNNAEDWASLERNHDLLAHAHIATQKERTKPKTEEEWKFFEKSINALRAIGYTGNLSFEGGFHEAKFMSEMAERMQAIAKQPL